MKIYIYFFLFFIAAMVLTSKGTNSINPAPLSKKNVAWDAESKTADVYDGEDEARFTFAFTNISSSNIVILDVHPSCGCTTVQMPPLPWTLTPAASGKIGVSVDLNQKHGTLSKTVTVNTDQGSKIITVKIHIIPEKDYPPMSNVERKQNLLAADEDRRAIFRDSCADCHVKDGKGKMGKELYAADCAICHEGSNRASMVPSLHSVAQSTDFEFWRTWIAYGRPHSLMPAFAVSEGGPLTDAQISSLAAYLNVAMPSSR